MVFALSAGTAGYASQASLSAGGWIYTNSALVFALTTWSHVMSTQTGTNSNIFVNGVNQGNNPNQYVIANVVQYYSYIGYRTYSQDGLVNTYLDDIIIFNRALTSTEVVSVYNYYL